MDKHKKQRLEWKGWKDGSVQGFLTLAPEEPAYVELKSALSGNIKKWRERKHLTQAEVARLLHSTQSRVAKMEAGDSTVSLDLLVRSLIALGATRRELAQVIGRD